VDERSSLIRNLDIYFAARKDIVLAILFGSFASGTQDESSDIDIAVHTTEPASVELLIDLQIDIGALCHRQIDILDLRQAEGTILCQVIAHGIKIKSNSSLFALYNLKAIYFHEDFLPSLRLMQEAKIRRFVNGD
jgi:predicted nucleotidyltransferase